MTEIEALAIYIIHKSIDIAKEKNDDRYYCDIYKLHKLLFYAQGIFLARHRIPLFREKIKAWDCGPLIEGLNRIKKIYGYGPITEYAKNSAVIPRHKKEILDYVVRRYGRLTREEIVNLSRNEQTWKDSRKRSCSSCPNPPMSISRINANFVESMRESNDRQYRKHLSIVYRQDS